MNQDIKQRWIDALRSGQYQQGNDCLRDAQDRFCCLGVLCDLYVKENAKPGSEDDWEQGSEGDDYDYCLHDSAGALPKAVQQWAGLKSHNPAVRRTGLKNHNPALRHHVALGYLIPISVLNDEHLSFNDIATIIEEQL
jgi:hypothetical protein